MSELVPDTAQVKTFMAKLETIMDPRDNRGKRHSLPFVLTAVSLAILTGRSSVSSIQRYIQNKIDWLRNITQQPQARPHLACPVAAHLGGGGLVRVEYRRGKPVRRPVRKERAGRMDGH